MAGNCSNTPPSSDVYLAEASEVEKAFIGVSTALCVVVLLLFADKVFFIHRYYANHGHHELIKQRSLVLVGIYPVVAVGSLLAIYVPRSKLLCDFLCTVYLAVCLYQFTSLIILYFGGTAELVETTKDTGFMLRAPPCCCCCFCCPTLAATKSNLTRLQMMVKQTAFLQPIVSFVSLVLLMDGKYNPGVTAVNSPATYLSAVTILSTLLAVYGLLVLFRSTRRYLATHNVTPKFLVLQIVLIVLNVQKFVMRVLAGNGVPPCVGHLASSVRADTIHHMLVIAEMCLLAIFARIIYRKPIMQELAGGYTSLEGDVSPKLCNNSTVQNGSPVDSGKTDHRSYDAMDERTSPESRPDNAMDERTSHESRSDNAMDERTSHQSRSEGIYSISYPDSD